MGEGEIMFTHKSTNVLPSLAGDWVYINSWGNSGCQRLTRSPMRRHIHIWIWLKKEEKQRTSCECRGFGRRELSRCAKRWKPLGLPGKQQKDQGNLLDWKLREIESLLEELSGQKDTCSFTSRYLWIVRWRNQWGRSQQWTRQRCLFIPHRGPCLSLPHLVTAPAQGGVTSTKATHSESGI